MAGDNGKRLVVVPDFHIKFKKEASARGLSIKDYSQELASENKPLTEVFKNFNTKKLRTKDGDMFGF